MRISILMTEFKYENMWSVADRYNLVLDVERYPDLICILCYEIVRNAVQSLCGCRFCHECLDNYMREWDEKRCPGLKVDCPFQMIILKDTVKDDHRANKDVSEILVKCPLEECQTHCKFIELEDHIQLHETCPFSWLGCVSSVENIGSHHIDYQQLHNELTVDSISRVEKQIKTSNTHFEKKITETKDTFSEEFRLLQERIGDLPIRDQTVAIVNNVLEALERQYKERLKNIESNVTNCTSRIELIETKQAEVEQRQSFLQQMWKMCNTETRITNIEADLASNQENQNQMKRDLDMCLQSRQNQFDDIELSSHPMFTRLRDGLINGLRPIIAQEVRAANRSPSNLEQNDICDLPHKKAKYENVINDSLASVADSTDNEERTIFPPSDGIHLLHPLKSESITLQFVVENFSSFLQLPTEKTVIFSEPFGSPLGHRFCLGIYPNGVDNGLGSHLSLRVLSVPGSFDHLVLWPQRHTFFISLLNQKTENSNFSKPCIEITWSVQRPSAGDLCNYKGQSRFYKLKQLLSNESLYRNDSIVVVVSISVLPPDNQ